MVFNFLKNLDKQVVHQFNAKDLEEYKDLKSKYQALDRAQAIIEFNLDGTITKANENFCKTVGYELKEIIGKHHRIFVEEEYANSQEYKNFWTALNAGKSFVSDYKRIRKDGNPIWISASYNCIFNDSGKPYKVVKFANDITEKVKTDQNLVATVLNIVDNSTESSDELRKYLASVSTAVEEMISSISEISANGERSTQMTSNAVNQIEASLEIIQILVKQSQEIGDILTIIDSIAKQTNLLALNATIEAARAGDAGRGFAVVANEVKELAGQTAEATQDINEKISAIQTEADKALKAMETTTESVKTINGSVVSIATAVEEQTAVTSEIGRSMNLSNDKIELLAENIHRIQESVKRNLTKA